jgi:hypothetical protein
MIEIFSNINLFEIAAYGTIGIFILSLFNFILKLTDHVKLFQRNKLLKQKLSTEFYPSEVIENSTLYYICPDCSIDDPTNSHEDQHVEAKRRNLFDVINDYLSKESRYRHILLLADSGMGKTSFVLNYYVYNHHLQRHNRQKLVIMPLNIPDADGYIKNIKDKQNTVIFLDTFDEDIKAIENMRKRLYEIIQICYQFKRVLITCRTQFFPKDIDIPINTGVIKTGPTMLLTSA